MPLGRQYIYQYVRNMRQIIGMWTLHTIPAYASCKFAGDCRWHESNNNRAHTLSNSNLLTPMRNMITPARHLHTHTSYCGLTTQDQPWPTPSARCSWSRRASESAALQPILPTTYRPIKQSYPAAHVNHRTSTTTLQVECAGDSKSAFRDVLATDWHRPAKHSG